MTAIANVPPAQVFGHLQAIDDLVRRGVGGNRGWNEQQDPGRYAPAIEHTKTAFHSLVREVLAHGPAQCIVQVGLGGQARHRALRTLAPRVVTIATDAAALQRLAREQPFDPEHDILLAGQAYEPALVQEVTALAAGCDLLLIDADDYHDTLRCWLALGPLVRSGGLVAFVDRSHELPELRHAADADRFAFDLEQHFLAARGRSLLRHDCGHVIHSYVRHGDDAEAAAAVWPRPPAEPAWQPFEGAMPGWSCFGRGAPAPAYRAVFGATATYRERQRSRHEFALVLAANDRDELLRRVDLYQHLQALVATAQEHLHAGDQAAWAQSQREAEAVPAAADAWLLDELQAQPHCRRLQVLVGLWWCLRGRADVGAALLSRYVDAVLTDGPAIRTLAQVHLLLRGDTAAARRLLTEVKQRIARHDLTRRCLQEEHAHALWGQPKLLGDARRILWVGAEGDAASHACRRLGLQLLWAANGNATDAVAEGTDLCAALIGGATGPGQLWRDPDGRACLRPYTSRFARSARLTPATAALPCVTQTLDDLRAAGRLDPACAEVLVIDVPGDEAAILHGATELLGSVQVLCLSVHHPVVFDTEPHQTLVKWLEGLGFAYVGAEATAAGHRAMTFLERVR